MNTAKSTSATIKITAVGQVFEFTPEQALEVHRQLDRRVVSFSPNPLHVSMGIAGSFVFFDDPDELRKLDWDMPGTASDGTITTMLKTHG